MKLKTTIRLLVVMVAIPIAYLLLISFIPEDWMVGFHWAR
jgi:hypothetical protein